MRGNGERAIGIGISTEAQTDVVKAGRRLTAELSALRSEMPVGLSLSVLYPEDRIAREATTGFLWNLVESVVIVIGMLMLVSFLRECKVTERLVQASQNEIINIVTIFLGTSVGLTMQGDRFLQAETLLIILLGIVAFGVATAGGVIAAKLMNLIWRKNPVNPLIGSAGVSAVPMAARVSHNVGQKYDPSNYLLMHAMGPNVAGVIGTAVIAGYYIATLAK